MLSIGKLPIANPRFLANPAKDECSVDESSALTNMTFHCAKKAHVECVEGGVGKSETVIHYSLTLLPTLLLRKTLQPLLHLGR